MVWDCIPVSGAEDLFQISGIMNAEKYNQILIHHSIHLENVWLSTPKYFSMTKILNTLPIQKKETWIEEHTEKPWELFLEASLKKWQETCLRSVEE